MGQSRVEQIFRESIEVKERCLADNAAKIVELARLMTECFRKGNKVLIFGNGGSAADSQHIAAELIGRFQKERRGLPAIALSADTSILTSLGNDYSFEIIFARQIEALGQNGDVALGISTSGHSANVIAAMRAAKKRGMNTVALTGQGGGKLAGEVDLCLAVPSKVTARIQEAHSVIAHAFCELVEEAL